jgi:hypothetical protein
LNFIAGKSNDETEQEMTVAIMHFGVSNQSTPKANCSPESAPTIIYGKHAKSLTELLERDGVPVVIAKTAQILQVAAVKKLASSSLMWLLCHGIKDTPLTVKEVHSSYSNKLQQLVEEVIPLLETLAMEQWMNTTQQHGRMYTIGSVPEMMDYLHTYSMSISDGDVTLNCKLALKEIHERNGLILSLMNENQYENSFHLELIRQVAGEELAAQYTRSSTLLGGSTISKATKCSKQRTVPCTSSVLNVLAHKRSVKTDSALATKSSKSVVVIGAGVVGSSIAYHLSRRGVNVVVMDTSNKLLPANGGIDPGTATSTSFAWLNANDKYPLSYLQLNQLGMEM